jgi:sarcosine oxidase subunit delta
MLLLTCPNCSAECAETELAAGGAAHLKRHAARASDADFVTYPFTCNNPKGLHF